jgi:hypothetical protein
MLIQILLVVSQLGGLAALAHICAKTSNTPLVATLHEGLDHYDN